MSRTRNKRRPKPRPGAAKLAVELDQKIGENSSKLSTQLINDFLAGSPTAQNIIASWAQDAEFGEQCVKVHGKTLSQMIQDIEEDLAKEKEEKEKAQQQSAETTVPAGELHS